jgi:anti-anti-sigma factor
VIYTDGLVERRGAALDDGLQRLVDAVTPRRSEPLQALIDGVLGELVDGKGGNDDVAVVAVRLLPAPLLLDLPGEPARLVEVRRAVRRWAADAGLAAEAVEDLLLTIGEATGNAVEHAYRDADGRVVVEAALDGAGDVVVAVTDTGSWRPPPADPGFRGRGLQIIAALAHEVDLSPGPDGTTLRFVLTPRPGLPAVHRRRPTGEHGPAVPHPDEQPAGVELTEVQGVRCLALFGDLDLAGTTAVRELVLGRLTEPGPVTVDLTRLGVVTSVGAGLLLEVAERVGSQRDLDVLLPATGPARRMLELTGLASALSPEADDLPH